MRCSFWTLLLVLACSACAPKAEDAAEVAGRTAKLYYDALLEGKYDVFVAGIGPKVSLKEKADCSSTNRKIAIRA